MYRKISDVSRTKSQNLNVSHLGLQFVFAQYIEAKCWVENKNVVGAAPTYMYEDGTHKDDQWILVVSL